MAGEMSDWSNPTPQMKAELYVAYSFMIAQTLDMTTLDTLANQALDDRRLTEHQRDALLYQLERRVDCLQPKRRHRGPT